MVLEHSVPGKLTLFSERQGIELIVPGKYLAVVCWG